MKKYAFSILLFLLTSCWYGKTIIIDDYELTWGDYYESLWDKGYCIGCNGGGDKDSIIQGIKNIKWNYKVIIVEKDNSEKARWYAFLANGDSLRCRNDDKLIGPLLSSQIDSLIKTNNYTDLKEEVFIK